MSLVTPSIDPRLAGIAPGFRALSILVEAAQITHPEVAPAALTQACQQVLNDDVPWAQAHLAAWDEVFKNFGAKPKRTPCSASALRKRVLKDGSLPSLDPVVDIYNAVSIRYAIPVGGENLAAYSGAPRLTLAEDAKRVQTDVGAHDRDKLALANRRLATEQDENARLRKALDEAQKKLDAVTQLERASKERGNAQGGT